MTPADLARAALHLVDWLGCVLTGAAGALAMGGFGSLLEMDDVHRAALLHPGPVVMLVVMALAAQADGDRALAGDLWRP